MLEVYKIVHGQYDNIANISISFHSGLATRGNVFKLKHGVFKYDLRKYFFTNRIVNLWNDLPDYVVMAKSTNSFKGRLDKFWGSQEILYNWESEFYTGTGENKSFIKVKDCEYLSE
jgi:hypothetical protein